MANTQQTVRINIAEVGAQQAAKETKTLKQQIKELREELATLDSTTDEYNQKITQLGNLMHQQQEITEQAKISTQDYGQTLNNLSTVASGVVGSITAVQGVMSLLGGENEDAMKAVKTMTSLMGILQGLSAMEEFEKTMRRLWNDMKKLTTATNQENVSMKTNTIEAGKNAGAMTGAAAATKAQGIAAATATKGVNLLSLGFRKLGLAIKSFMMSNPFTLILLVITTAYTVISNIIDKQRQATEEMRKQKEELRQINEQDILDQSGSSAYSSGEKKILGKNYASQYPDFVKQSPDSTDAKNFWTNTYIQFKNALQKMEDANQKFTENYKTVYEGLIEDLEMQYASYIHWYEKEIERINKATVNDYKGTKGERERALKADQELVKKYTESLDKYYIKLYDIYEAGRQYQKEYTKATTDKEEAAKKERTAKYKDWQAKQRKLLDDEYNKQKTQADNQYKAGLISAEEYYNKLKKIEDDYLKSYKDNKIKIGLTKKEEEVFTEAYRSKIIDINKSLQAELQRICKEQNDLETQIKENNLKLETEIAEETLRRSQQDQQALAGNDNWIEKQVEFQEGWLKKKLTMIQEAEDQQYQIEYEANQKHLELQIERLQKDMEFAQQQKEMNDWNEDLTYGNNVEQLQMQKEAELQLMQTYAEQTEATEEQIAQRRTEIEEEYDTKLQQLRVQHLQNLKQIENDYITDRADSEYQLSEYIYQLHENEYNHEVEMFQKKQELTRTYLSAFSTMVGGVQGLLSELQGAYEQGSKEYEAIEEANIIMSGITGALQAWQSGMAAAPAPWNLAIAAAMSGLSVATTIAALANLKNKKLSTSASQASLNITPYETVATETGAELNGQIADTRVYVVEEDIADTARRVYVAESEASF